MSSAPGGGARPTRDTADPYRYGDTIHGVFAERAASQPHAPAVIRGDEIVSYRDLAAAADALAASFAGRGVSAGCVAVVRMRRSPVLPAVLLAILRLGAAYLAAELTWPAEYVQDMIGRADAWLVTDDPDPGLESGQGTLIVDTDVLPRGVPDAPPEPAVSRDAACTIFQTSGSTGSPKLAVVPHRATVRAFIGADYADFGPGRVIMQTSPVCWDGFSLELWSVLLNGGTSLIPPAGAAVNGDLLRSCSAEYGLDTLWLTSSLFSALADDDVAAFAGIRQVMSGGERISPDHVRRLLSAHPDIRFSSGYGPVETTVFATSHTVSPGDLDRYGEVPLGHPLPATTVLVLDEAGDLCPPGQAGEIHIGGDALGLGYLGDPAGTRQRFISSPFGPLYRTGDRGEWHEAGPLLFRGRVDRQLKIRGQRAEPEEVERFIARALPGVVAAVTPVTDRRGQVIGLAAHCATGGRDTGPGDIRAACQAGLPPHLRPRQISVQTELPRNGNGKVDYAALTRPSEVAGTGREALAIRSHDGSVAGRIARIASDLLGTAAGLSDDLFELGGDSLFAMRLAARLRREEGIGLPVGLIQRERTAARLAKLAAHDPVLPAPSAGAVRELSPGEEDLCLHEEISPGDPALLLLSAYELAGNVDLERLRRAVVRTCLRHPALSTVRIPEAGKIRAHQLLAAEVDRQLPLQRRDEALTEADGALDFPDEWLGAFDLARELPLRMYAAGKPGGPRQLALVIHHVAMDGWSERLFTAALARAYDEATGERAGPRAPGVLPVLAPRAAGPAERDRARDYWRAVLSGLDPLPVPLARPGKNSFSENRLALSPAQCRALAALSGRHNDLHAGALAWYADALRHTFSGTDFAVGSAYAARDLADEEAIGYYVQMIPVRISYPQALSLSGLAADISGQWLASLDQRSLSLREIAACVPEARARGHRPVFQAGFALQQDAPSYLELAGARHPRLAVRPPAPPFELYLELWPGPDGGVTACLQWDAACVADAAAAQVAGRLHGTAEALSQRPGAGRTG